MIRSPMGYCRLATKAEKEALKSGSQLTSIIIFALCVRIFIYELSKQTSFSEYFS